MAEEEKGFVIRDRRGRGAEGQEAPTSEQAATAQSQETSALMLLGESPGQEGVSVPQSLSHAQEIIDVLTILETKTKGNLTQEEETLLQEMLYTLRIKYVDKASSSKS